MDKEKDDLIRKNLSEPFKDIYRTPIEVPISALDDGKSYQWKMISKDEFELFENDVATGIRSSLDEIRSFESKHKRSRIVKSQVLQKYNI